MRNIREFEGLYQMRILTSALVAVNFVAFLCTAAFAEDSKPSGLKSIFSDEQSFAPSDTPWSVMVFAGKLSSDELSRIIFPKRTPRFQQTWFLGATLAKEVARWNSFSVELEGGAGLQYGGRGNSDDTSPQIWGAAYLRYDGFPWNHIVHTSIAGSVGVNYSFKKTAFENAETNFGDTKKLLHYFSPELTFALPENKQQELVIRLHHRSGANGAFGCDGCGSNVVTLGIRHRF